MQSKLGVFKQMVEIRINARFKLADYLDCSVALDRIGQVGCGSLSLFSFIATGG